MTNKEAAEIILNYDAYGCGYCHQGGDGVPKAFDMAAKALLKVPEPRVMTLEEYDAWTDLPIAERDPVFYEERTERGSVTCWVNVTVCSLSEYGKHDRCWTSRPTDEQREATPWTT